MVATQLCESIIPMDELILIKIEQARTTTPKMNNRNGTSELDDMAFDEYVQR